MKLGRPATFGPAVSDASPVLSPLDVALAWATEGFEVFPICISPKERDRVSGGEGPKTDKKPLCAHGFKDATTDPNTIRQMFSQHAGLPELAAGVVPASGGCVVIDDDGGLPAALEAEGLELPDTFTVNTASGGRHYWFAKLDPDEMISSRNGTPWPAVDVRSDRGYVVAPGTVVTIDTPLGPQRCAWEPVDATASFAAIPRVLHERITQTDPATQRPSRRRSRPARTADRPDEGPTRRHRELKTESTTGLNGLDEHALEVLESLGGHHPSVDNAGLISVTRPGREAGRSATIGHHSPGVIRFWSPNWENPAQPGTYFDTDVRYVTDGDRIIPDETSQRPEVRVGPSKVIDGLSFVFEPPAAAAAIWGDGNEVLWAHGESCLIVGPSGVGKSTLALQLVGGLLGVEDSLFGYPITPIDGNVLYLAMDRPAQLQRLVQLKYANAARGPFAQLVVHQGPLDKTFNSRPEILAETCKAVGARAVIIDSVKDAAPSLSDDEAGGSVNRAIQLALAEGVQVLGLHHLTKSITGKPTLDNVYGSTLITAGAGSVLALHRSAKTASLAMHHLKQPMDVVGPLEFRHDYSTVTSSRITVQRARSAADIVLSSSQPLTTHAVAQLLFGVDEPIDADIRRTRNALNKAVELGVLSVDKGARGGNCRQQPHLYSRPGLRP